MQSGLNPAPMKKTVLSAALVVLLASSSFGQLLLNSGDTWTYNFNSLPHTGFVSAFGSNPGGSFQFTIDGASFQAGDQLKYEMFENTASEQPVCTGIFNSAPPNTATCSTDFVWQDQQGAVRLTMLAGSLVVDSVTLKAIIPGPSLSSYDVYSSTFTPVPEPSMVLLLALGVALTMCWVTGKWKTFS